MKNKNISPIGDSWECVRNEIFTPDERIASDERVALAIEIINARKNSKISQKDLEMLSGVKQPVIARLETGKTDPQFSTVIKLLNSLGKTIKIVPLENDKHPEPKPLVIRRRKTVSCRTKDHIVAYNRKILK